MRSNAASGSSCKPANALACTKRTSAPSRTALRRATASACGERSTAVTRASGISRARLTAMQPLPVPTSSAAASGQVGFEIGNVERKPGRYAVERDADLRTVGFAPKGDAEESAETVHRYGSVKAATCHSTPPHLKALPARRALPEAPAKAGVWGWVQSVNAA